MKDITQQEFEELILRLVEGKTKKKDSSFKEKLEVNLSSKPCKVTKEDTVDCIPERELEKE